MDVEDEVVRGRIDFLWRHDEWASAVGSVYELSKMKSRDFPHGTGSTAPEEREILPNSAIIRCPKRQLLFDESSSGVDQPPVSQPSAFGGSTNDLLEVNDVDNSPSAKSASYICDEGREEPRSSYFQSRAMLTHYNMGKLPSGSSSKELTLQVGSSMGPTRPNFSNPGRVHWKDRFVRLQMFLRRLDQSDQYIQMLRSLTTADRKKHAVEQERRAMQLMDEEGKELHRLKLLNVMGDGSSKFT